MVKPIAFNARNGEKMRHSKYNRYERKVMQQEKLAHSLSGTGLYVFKNPSRTGTLTLPKPTASGRRTVGPLEEFQGDSYFMNLVLTQDLIKVRTIMTPEQEKSEKNIAEAKAICDAKTAIAEKLAAEESVLTESSEEKTAKNRQPRKVETMNPKQKKLVLDQPDRITTEGKVENVVKEEGHHQLNDHDENKRRPDILLIEAPCGEIVIE